MSEHLPALFRGRTPAEAQDAAKAWARAEGLRLRTVASVRPAEGFPDWPSDDDPYVALHAYTVVLAVDMPETGALPEPPTLWGAL